jgi:glycosyltransferase involved in cell wall biosynthesis
VRLPLSVCLIARDEAANLPAALGSVRDVAAEIVVVDTGSRDRTVEVARALGARVEHFVWIDDFSAARNFAIEQASQAYILSLDADERLEPGSDAALERYCTQANGRAGRVLLSNLDGATVLSVDALTRLHPNQPSYRYQGRIHEQLRLNGAPPPIYQTNVRLTHTGYSQAALKTAGKVERNLRLLSLAEADDPGEPYLSYQRGRTLAAAGEHRQAAEAFRAALGKLGDRPPSSVAYLPSLLLQLGYACLRANDVPGTLEVLSLATDLYPDFTDLYFLYALALTELGDPSRLDDIRLAYEHCLSLGEPDPARYESVPGVGSFRAAHNLGALWESLGHTQRAREWYQRAAASDFEPARRRLQSI